MSRMTMSPNVLGETTVTRAQRFGHVERWLVVTTSLEADDTAMARLITEIHSLLENRPELAGFEIHSARHI
jgi:hypothetical protein